MTARLAQPLTPQRQTKASQVGRWAANIGASASGMRAALLPYSRERASLSPRQSGESRLLASVKHGKIGLVDQLCPLPAICGGILSRGIALLRVGRRCATTEARISHVCQGTKHEPAHRQTDGTATGARLVQQARHHCRRTCHRSCLSHAAGHHPRLPSAAKSGSARLARHAAGASNRHGSVAGHRRPPISTSLR